MCVDLCIDGRAAYMPEPTEPPAGLTAGGRIKFHRERVGMSRRVLSGLVGRSPEWVKAVETGRLQTPRLSMLLRIARALDVRNLADLTGDEHQVPVEAFASAPHAALPAVRAALTDYQLLAAGPPPSLAHLEARLGQAWTVRHRSPDHRTQLGTLLPGLIRDAQRAVRLHDGDDRRRARQLLARVYQLVDFYVAYQPAAELLWLVVDRAMIEARETDDPDVLAGSAWALVQALRDAGRWDEAVTVATDAMRVLAPDPPPVGDDRLAMWGALQFEVALVHARRGRAGQAYRHLDLADGAAQRLPAGYRHVQSSFSRALMGAQAVTIAVELRRPGEAVRAAEATDPDAIASVPRRSRHLIEVARAHHQRHDKLATLMLVGKAHAVAPETVAYNADARAMLLELVDAPPPGFRAEARALAGRLGLVG